MSKSLFRFVDRFELLSCYLICFISNIAFNFSKTAIVNSHFLQTFLKQIYDYQVYIILLLSFIVVITHYQILYRKKVEIYCRVLVGDTRLGITIRYITECLTILVIAYTLSIIIQSVLDVNMSNNIYLSYLFLAHILFSSKGVWKVGNF